MRKTLCYFVMCLAASMSAALADGTQQERKARAFVEELSQKTINIAAQKNTSFASRQKKLKRLFHAYVDTRWMGKFVLGKHWRSLTKAQRSHYLREYGKFLADHYTSRFDEYDGETVDIRQVRTQKNGHVFVFTTIVRPAQANVQVDYRLHRQKGKLKIYDIIVEGVSLITTQRSEFSAVMARHGIDGLTEQLVARRHTP